MGCGMFPVGPGNRHTPPFTSQPCRLAIWLTSVVLILGLESACTSKTDFQESLGGPLGMYPDHALGHFTPAERREYESQWQRREQETKAGDRAQ